MKSKVCEISTISFWKRVHDSFISSDDENDFHLCNKGI